jgi:hypothetical protein
MKMPWLALHAISLRQEFKPRYPNEANYCGLCVKLNVRRIAAPENAPSSNHQHQEKRQAPILNQIADGAFWSLAD